MKRVVVLLLLLLPLIVLAQQKGFTSFYNAYSGRDGYTTIEITGEMIKMMGNMMLEKSDDGDLSKMLEGIKSIKIVVSDAPSTSFVTEMNAIVSGSPYKLMTSIMQGGQTTKFYFIERQMAKNEVGSTPATEFLMLSHGAKDNVVINITGNIDVQKISKLSSVKIGGMEKLNSGSNGK